MPRGKNYVNQNRGVFLQAPKKNKSGTSGKKGTIMEACFYGAGCTRKDCFYRHDVAPGPASTNNTNDSNTSTSHEPCMAFLANRCVFTATTCLKRHPPKEEVARLIARYQSIPCRYGDNCLTDGCLYVHPSDPMPQGQNLEEKKTNEQELQNEALNNPMPYHPLLGPSTTATMTNRSSATFAPELSTVSCGPGVAGTNWKPAPPTGARVGGVPSQLSTTMIAPVRQGHPGLPAVPPLQPPPSTYLPYSQPMPTTSALPILGSSAMVSSSSSSPPMLFQRTQLPPPPPASSAAPHPFNTNKLPPPMAATTWLATGAMSPPTDRLIMAPVAVVAAAPPPPAASGVLSPPSAVLNIHAREYVPATWTSTSTNTIPPPPPKHPPS